LAGAPIYIDDKFAGVLVLLSATPGSYTYGHKASVEVVARQVAIAIKNARLIESKQELRVLAEALRDTIAALHSTLDVEKVMGIILGTIKSAEPSRV
jgi:GAF domain-containing protein